ncbi:MAG: helix-turn-helix transcriptional regulator [Gammaproteobacteria bacterium]|mgnify:CR=1 FL=1|jgi:transcriptional regulator with XRE-family HTH domain|nr:helix-turn-helix transcriptional regulator [Gammaproteobacteria bacterium]MBT4379594.1 helix-turn-helix transcriptional regulator [Gammaproteobacteria bacterium]MBT4615994.1 helix-turn-helix transcriptional regulator [Gammaproteobacteria bacterium]MBT5196962.1 helix-turn-helix transcriptional regulator [Gammaproteobacteria bacterium]MBT5442270.1 helix-turn-helix transcriptional regulator [Gammaproteobacteria bacterium]
MTKEDLQTLEKAAAKTHQSERYTQRVAALLKYVRRKAGLSARELARTVGSSHSTILAYESGKKMPITTTLMRLVHACGYSMDFSLSPRLRGDADNPKGAELQAVLDLAAEFPARHSDTPDSRMPDTQ